MNSIEEAIEGEDPFYLNLSISTKKDQNKIKNYNKWRKNIQIDIKKPAKQNKANQELKKFLAKKIGLNSKNIKISSGKTSTKKKVKITGIEKQKLTQKIKKAIS